MPAGVANGFIVDCVFTHISGDSLACSSADIRRVEERERRIGVLLISDVGSNFNPFRDSVSNSPYIHSLKSVFWHKLLQNFKLPIYKTGHYGPFYCLFMKLYQWSLDRDGRIYRSIINCSKLPCSGVWRAGAEASPLQPRPQVRPRAGGHEAGAPQQAHRWAVIGGERVTWPHCSYLIGPPPQRCPPGTGRGSWSRPRPATTAPSLTPTSRSSARTPPPPRWRTLGTGSG